MASPRFSAIRATSFARVLVCCFRTMRPAFARDSLTLFRPPIICFEAFQGSPKVITGRYTRPGRPFPRGIPTGLDSVRSPKALRLDRTPGDRSCAAIVRTAANRCSQITTVKEWLNIAVLARNKYHATMLNTSEVLIAANGGSGSVSTALTPHANLVLGVCCLWCGRTFPSRTTGGSAQKFCCTEHRQQFWIAARRWTMRGIEAGLLSVDCLKASHTSVHAVPGGILT
jgi:hypothetical protein